MTPDLWQRGIERIYPSLPDRPLKIYFGIDPTAPTLHLGHASVLLKLRDLQAAGHQIIILIGDFTALIGDPTDKKAARIRLTPAEIKANLKAYRKQIGKILDLKKIKVEFNRRWLGKLKLEQVLELAAEFTVAQMLERDMFQTRIREEAPIYLHEFLYPLLQGYDSVALGVDAEIGASDQTFNMLIGRQMLTKRGREKFVIATKLLVDATGKKMGKSESNMITLDAAPAAVYGAVMSWPDEVMPLGFEILTRLPFEAALTLAVAEPKVAKMQLAREITKLLHGEKKAAQAERQFISAFQNKEWPIDALEIEVAPGANLGEILKERGVVESLGDWQRLVNQKAVEIWESGELITDHRQTAKADLRLKVGKRRFVAIKLI